MKKFLMILLCGLLLAGCSSDEADQEQCKSCDPETSEPGDHIVREKQCSICNRYKDEHHGDHELCLREKEWLKTLNEDRNARGARKNNDDVPPVIFWWWLLSD